MQTPAKILRLALAVPLVGTGSACASPQPSTDAPSTPPAPDPAESPASPEGSPTVDAARPSSKHAALINERLAESEFPALGVVVVDGEQVIVVDVAGVRSLRDPSPVTLDDRWHLGSNTKAMTATMVAMLVDEGVVDWDSPVPTLFPDLDPDPAWQAVTLQHLLDHRAGLPPDFPPDFRQRSSQGADEDQRALRAEWAASVLAEAPAGEVGEFGYSNGGYTLLGVLLETRWDAPFAELIEQRLWTPLGMDSCGLGGPGSDNALGHAGRVAQGPGADNPPIASPAGRAHCTLADYGKFLQLHLRAARGQPRLLSEQAFAALHTPRDGQNYAGGWIAVGPPKAPAPMLGHDGSNTLWYASAAIFPEADRAIAVITNTGAPPAPQAIPALLLAIARSEGVGGPSTTDATR